MRDTINLYWFHNDASEKNNSLNGHSTEPQINLKEVHHTSCHNKSPWYILKRKGPKMDRWGTPEVIC